MGEKAPQRRQDDGRLSLLPILTERKVGPSRFPCGWRQVANRSRLDTGSVERLTLRKSDSSSGRLCHLLKADGGGRLFLGQSSAERAEPRSSHSVGSKLAPAESIKNERGLGEKGRVREVIC